MIHLSDDLRLQQSIDHCIHPLNDVRPLDEFIILETDGSCIHTTVLVEVGSGSIEDREVVLLVPDDRIRFHELSSVYEESFWDSRDGHTGR